MSSKYKSLEDSVEATNTLCQDVISHIRDSFDMEGLTSEVAKNVSLMINAQARLMAETIKLRKHQANELASMAPEERDELALEHLLSRPVETLRYARDEIQNVLTEKTKKHVK